MSIVYLNNGLKDVGSRITVELYAFLVLFTTMLTSAAAYSLGLYKTCLVHLEYEDYVCENFQRFIQENDEFSKNLHVQYMWSLRWKNIIQSFVPCLVFLFLGGWSDKTGRRKALLLLPIAASVLQAIGTFFNLLLFDRLPIQAHLFFDAFLVSGVGGSSAIFLAVFTYVHVTNSENKRLYRFAASTICAFAGASLGVTISGLIMKFLSYLFILGLASFFNVMNTWYVIYHMSDPPRNEEQLAYDNQSVFQFVRTFFDISSIKETVLVISQNNADNRTLKLCVHLFTMTILSICVYGEFHMFNVYARFHLYWNEGKIIQFYVYHITMTMLGIWISVLVVIKWLRWHESVIGIISSISKIVSSFVFCFAASNIVFFFGPLVEMFYTSVLIAVTTMMSNLLSSNEIGKINSLICFIWNLIRLAYVPLYSYFYSATSTSLPGALFLLGGAFTVPALLVFIWILYTHLQNVRLPNVNRT